MSHNNSEAFRRWFGDSKVVSERGEPLVVHHGTPDARFILQEGQFRCERDRYGMGRSTHAHWFARSLSAARSYADDRRAFDYQKAKPGVISVFLKLENPLEIDAKGSSWREVQARGKTSDVIDVARQEGRDGVIIRNVRDHYSDHETGRKSTPTDTYVVFSPQQIKSAEKNSGAFDPSNPNIFDAPPEPEAQRSRQAEPDEEYSP